MAQQVGPVFKNLYRLSAYYSCIPMYGTSQYMPAAVDVHPPTS